MANRAYSTNTPLHPSRGIRVVFSTGRRTFEAGSFQTLHFDGIEMRGDGNPIATRCVESGWITDKGHFQHFDLYDIPTPKPAAIAERDTPRLVVTNPRPTRRPKGVFYASGQHGRYMRINDDGVLLKRGWYFYGADINAIGPFPSHRQAWLSQCGLDVLRTA